jgi:hypothetical protein
MRTISVAAIALVLAASGALAPRLTDARVRVPVAPQASSITFSAVMRTSSARAAPVVSR